MTDSQPAPESASVTVSIPCSGCSKTLRIKAALAGKKGKCPQCGTVVAIPEAAPAQLPSPARPPGRVLRSVAIGLALAAVLMSSALTLLLLPRSGGGVPEVSQLQQAADRVKALESNIIDVRDFPTITVTDRDLTALRGLSNLRKLVLNHSAVTDAGMKEVGGATSLVILSLGETQVTDAGLAEIKSLTGLEELRLDKARITDAGLVHVKPLPQLRMLSLYKTEITDAGLVHLKDLFFLEHLSLDATRVTDHGLSHLAGLSNLRYLSVWQTSVTEAGRRELQKALPRVKINH